MTMAVRFYAMLCIFHRRWHGLNWDHSYHSYFVNDWNLDRTGLAENSIQEKAPGPSILTDNIVSFPHLSNFSTSHLICCIQSLMNRPAWMLLSFQSMMSSSWLKDLHSGPNTSTVFTCMNRLILMWPTLLYSIEIWHETGSAYRLLRFNQDWFQRYRWKCQKRCEIYWYLSWVFLK